jgi:hypothetical protein
MEQDRMVVSLKAAPKKEVGVAEPMVQKRSVSRTTGSKRMMNLLGLLLFLAVAGTGAYFVIDFSSVATLLPQAPTKAGSASVPSGDSDVAEIAAIEQEVSDVIAAIGKHILLPEGEEPTVATVSDPEKLKDQQFFKHAQSGDKVLIYTKAKMAYLYDPRRDILLEVAPITTDAP